MQSSFSPAKLILTGEHFVVYDNPAIALPVAGAFVRARITHIANQQCLCFENALEPDVKRGVEQMLPILLEEFQIAASVNELQIYLEIHMPLGGGMGGSAALSVVLSRALGRAFGLEPSQADLMNAAAKTERIFHGNPSGIDHTVIVKERCIWFTKKQGACFLESVQQPVLLIVDSGTRGLTRRAVDLVRVFATKHEHRFAKMLSEAAELANQMRSILESAVGDWTQMGEFLNQNHELLRELGVSTPELEEVVGIVRQLGAVGAKLSGAGLGGIVVALVEPERMAGVRGVLLQKNYTVYSSLLSSN